VQEDVERASSFGAAASLRLSGSWALGLYGQYAMAKLKQGDDGFCLPEDTDCKGYVLRYGATLGYHFTPDSTWDWWVSLSLGREVYQLTARSSGTYVRRATGLELNGQGGVLFPLGGGVKLGPYLEWSTSRTTKLEFGPEREMEEEEDLGTPIHAWIGMGVRLLWGVYRS